jgi:CHAT domain-containing protein/tetratricopeptide (TPR) repeat protein
MSKRSLLVGGQFVVLVVLAGGLLSPLGQAADEPTTKQRQELEKKAEALNDQGVSLYGRGKHQEATKLLREALVIRRKLYGGLPQGHPDLAESLTNLGFLLRAQGEYAQAEPLCREALQMCRVLYPKEKYPQGHLELVGCLNNLGSLFQEQGEHARAEPLAREGVAMCRALFPRTKYPQGHPDLAGSLSNLGVLLQAQGEYIRAEPLFREALQIRRELFPKAKYPLGHPDLAVSLSNLGALQQWQGEFAKAESFYREALAMRRALYPREKFPHGHLQLALSLNNLAALQQWQGDYGGAEKLFREALEMNRALYPRERYSRGHPELVRGLNNLGFLLQLREQYAEAEPFLREALEMNRALFPREAFPHGHPYLAGSLNNLAGLLRDRGEYDKAEPLFREALQMRRALYPRETFPQGHPQLATSLSNLGALLHAQGRYAPAEALYRESLAMHRAHLGRLAELSAEAEALNFAATFPRTQDGYLSLTRHLSSATGAYDEMWQRKALLSRILERRHLDLLASKDPEAQKLGRELAATRQRLARFLMAPARDSKEHTRLLDQLTEEKEGLEKRLVQQLRLKAPASTAQAPPKALADALPPKSVFLDLIRYFDFELSPERPGVKGERWSVRYVAFLLEPGKNTVRRIELGPAGPIERAWRTWRQAIVDNRPDRDAATRFARLAWEPLAKHLPADLRVVFLSADYALTQVPWAALPGKKPGSVLLEDYAVAIVPHGPWLLRQLEQKPRPRAADDLLLVAGNIAYERTPAALEKPPAEEVGLRAPPLAGKRVVWEDLAGTAREQQQIVALGRKVFRKEPLRRSGATASTAQLQEDLPRVRYAHLATHGFLADAQFRSAFQVDEAQYRFATVDRRTAGARSPLGLSGLVLAGANRTGKEAAADRGILTAEALVGLNLHGMDLAVLSACDSGRGAFDVAGGEGVYGLQRAFHLAGCKNVIASLWKVDDEATAALMGVFYRKLWAEEREPLEALRAAQLYLYRNPSAIVTLAKRRGDLFAEVDLPKETVKPGEPAKHALTSQWAAFVLSGTGR